MVATIHMTHVYKYPIDIVSQTHLSKYPTEKEKFVKAIQILERNKDRRKGIDYRKSIAICENVIPRILRLIPILNEPAVILEEKSWLNLKTHHLNTSSRNVTWEKYADMTEKSSFTVHHSNPKWTLYKQEGRIDINGIGPFGRVIELFAKRFLDDGAKKAIKIMEELIEERLSGSKSVGSHKTGIKLESS